MKKKMMVLFSVALLITSLLSSSIAYGQCMNGPNKCMHKQSKDMDKLSKCMHKPNKEKFEAIVSTDWLQNNLDMKDLVILDIRTSDEYEAGHIVGSINIPLEVPFSAWITMTDGLLFELPDTEELFNTLGNFGISKKSKVVIVTSVSDPFAIGAGPRVACTLIYAGVKNVSILDGGHAKWASEEKAVTTEVPEISPKTFDGKINNIFVPIDYVESKIGESVIIDNRDYNVYTGEVIEPYAPKAGHIPTAKSLPAPLMWNEDGTYKSIDELKDMAKSVALRNDKIIVYCGVGGYASSWWFILSEVLNYPNVVFYDGSAEEWVRYNDVVLD